jgi:phage terminase small subunit
MATAAGRFALRAGDGMRQLKARMTPKQRRFVLEYIVDLNATHAAIRAGYSPKGAGQKGWQLLNWRPAIAEAVRQAQEARAQRTLITADRVLQQLGRIAFADVRKLTRSGDKGPEFKPLGELTEEEAAAIAEFSSDGKATRIKLHDRLQALDAIARHIGFYDKPAPPPPGLAPEGGLPAREILRRRLEKIAEAAAAKRAREAQAPGEP